MLSFHNEHHIEPLRQFHHIVDFHPDGGLCGNAHCKERCKQYAEDSFHTLPILFPLAATLTLGTLGVNSLLGLAFLFLYGLEHLAGLLGRDARLALLPLRLLVLLILLIRVLVLILVLVLLILVLILILLLLILILPVLVLVLILVLILILVLLVLNQHVARIDIVLLCSVVVGSAKKTLGKCIYRTLPVLCSYCHVAKVEEILGGIRTRRSRILHGLELSHRPLYIPFAIESVAQIVTGNHPRGILQQSLAVADIGLGIRSVAELAVPPPDVGPLAISGNAAQRQQYYKKASHLSNSFRLGRRSPTSISITKNSSARPKKYMYCSSYSSNTTLPKSSSSIARMS